MIDDKLTVTPRCFELWTTSNSCPFIRWAETPAGFWQMRFSRSSLYLLSSVTVSEDRCTTIW